jgi:ABC-type spermidine/putrescine transport system permease subunit I
MSPRFATLCFAPILLVLLSLLAAPLAFVAEESLREFTPGRIGSVEGAPLTLGNYLKLASPAYAGYFLMTYRLSLIGAAIAVLIGFPIAYHLARSRDSAARNLLLGGLVVLMFVSALVRVYAIELTFGSVGIVRPLLEWLAVNPNGRLYLEALVVAGLLHVTVPIATLTLIGAIQNVNPRIAEAAQSLGASRTEAHLSVTLPLSLQGLLSAFLLAFTLGASAFVVPWILGRAGCSSFPT